MAGRDGQVEMGNGFSVRWDGSHNRACVMRYAVAKEVTR